MKQQEQQPKYAELDNGNSIGAGAGAKYAEQQNGRHERTESCDRRPGQDLPILYAGTAMLQPICPNPQFPIPF